MFDQLFYCSATAVPQKHKGTASDGMQFDRVLSCRLYDGNR